MFTPIVEQHAGIYANGSKKSRAFSPLGVKNVLEDLGARIKQFAKAAYGTQTALAKEIGTTSGQLSDYVSGRKSPGTEILRRLAIAGLNIHWLLTGEGEMLAADNVSGPRLVSPEEIEPHGEITGPTVGIEFRRIKGEWVPFTTTGHRVEPLPPTLTDEDDETTESTE